VCSVRGRVAARRGEVLGKFWGFSGKRRTRKMQIEQLFRFGPYRLDLATMQLWRGTQAVKLPPKALAVLCLLVTRAGHVVTKDEFFQTVWPDVVVGDDALRSCVQELRQALRDDARRPRFIETVHRRGFRFVAEVQSPRSKVCSLHSTIRLQLTWWVAPRPYLLARATSQSAKR
jgi:DNA-binding winged helix-turn-helix (wHTH) protein